MSERIRKVDTDRMSTGQSVQVGGDVEQRHFGHQMDEQDIESCPLPYPCHSLVTWLLITGCALALVIVSTPALREAAATWFASLF